MPLLDIFSKKNDKKEAKEKIEIDFREKNSLVPSELSRLGFQIEFRSLPIGDYITKNTAIERKSVSDFKSSIINKRIISQLLEIQQFPKKFLIIEGEKDSLFDGKGMHENAVRGFLLSVISEFSVPLIFTKDEKETALYISILAKKKEKSSFSTRPSKLVFSKEEQMQYILEGFPNIGPIKAKQLIEKFHCLKNIFSASEEELKEILGKRTEEFKKLLN